MKSLSFLNDKTNSSSSKSKWFIAASVPAVSPLLSLFDRFQRTVLDLTLPWRFANLPNNAKLEMVTSTRKQGVADSQVSQEYKDECV